MATDDPAQATTPSTRTRSWLLVAGAVVLAIALAIVCIWAEEASRWSWAQGAFIGTLFFLLLAGLDWWRQHRVKHEFSTEVRTYYQGLRYLLLALAVGFISILIIAVGKEHWQNGIVARSVGTGILFGGSTFAIGVLLGFLFGFPPAPGSNSPPTNDLTFGPRSPSVFQNTNLHEISDWLTKVIVGASLVELTKLPPLLENLAWFMAKYTNPYDPSPAVALVIMGYFWSCGILFGYLWTRYEISLTAILPDRDISALTAVDGWLNQSPGPKDDERRAVMMAAIKASSAGARIKIFLDAEKYRRPGTEEVNERSLPVFQALVEADPQELFHRNRSQCALALMGKKKDPKNPAASKTDWSGALDLLNEAIQIRDRSREPNWRQYELARAVCRIRLDEQFNQNKASAPDAVQEIQADIDKTGDISPEERKLIDIVDAATQKGVIATWQELNAASGT